MQHGARALMISAAAAAMFASVLIWAIAAGDARGDTPTPTVSPTPSASPTPYPQSTITIQFVRDGEPVEVFLWSPLSGLEADGVECVVAVEGLATFFPGYAINWPLPAEEFQPEPCSSPPPTTLVFEFNAAGTIFEVEVLWDGGDLVIDKDVSFLEEDGATPTPYPQSTITIRFVRDGEPVEVTTTAPIAGLTVDGVACNSALLPLIGEFPRDSYTFSWPPFPGEVDDRCLEGPPTTVTVWFAYIGGSFQVPVEWTGEDVTVDYEVPLDAIAPSELPETGGAASSGGSGVAVALLAAGAAAVVAGAALVARRFR